MYHPKRIYVEPSDIGQAAMDLWHLPEIGDTQTKNLQFRMTLEIVNSETGEVLGTKVWNDIDLWP
jgi:hypothetical protein